jgi:hypothetical protein
MLLHIADENAREYRQPLRLVVTRALLEEREWASFTAQVRRGRLVGLGDVDVDIDEEDVGQLLAVVAVLDRARDVNSKFTLAEVVRGLQQDRVLSVEFVAAARGQAQRLLSMLVGVGRVRQDKYGAYSLARDW